MDVGVRELKDRLSEILDRAAAGEVVRVTDRGVPKALIVPVNSADSVARGLAEGWLTRRSTRAPGAYRPQKTLPGTPTSTEILSADRGD